MATAIVPQAAHARPGFSRLFLALASLCLGVALTACGGGGDPAPAPTGPSSPATPTTPTTSAQPTSAGAPHGAPVSRSIGPEGGTLTSGDGRLTLTVPPGAFAQATTVAIQPIGNTAHGAKGPAYRITPEGLHTPVPMTLSFQADAQVLDGTAFDALTIATQDADGRWHAKRSPVRNAGAGTLQVGTHHFSDWAVIAGAQLRPGQAELATGSEIELTLIVCPQRPDLGDPDTSTVDACREPVLLPNELENWSVNGVLGGALTLGRVAPVPVSGPLAQSSRARYAAPQDVPTPNPVAVSVDYNELMPGAVPLRLVSHITIVRPGQCGWLRNMATLNFAVSLDYHFEGSGPLGTLLLNQRGNMVGQLQSVDQNDLFGTWYGLTTQGEAHLSDQHSSGDVVSVLSGNGIPAIGTGIDDNQISGATLVVNYRDCTYAITAQIAVLASSGAANDPPRPRSVGSFTRGNLLAGRYEGLSGRAEMPPRLVPDAEGTYAPGGLGVGLVADGYATDQTSGRALITWSIERNAP